MTFLLVSACADPASTNEAPEVEITSPGEGAEFHEAEPFSVVATYADDQGAADLVLTWSIEPEVDVEANEFRGEAESTMYYGAGLPLGAYTVSVLAIDGFQEATHAEVAFTVDENSPPKVTIDEPADGATYAVGESVGVSVVVKQRDDDMSNIVLTWGGVAEGYPSAPERPNADGAAIFYITDLERGKHELSVTASDGVASASASVSFRIAL